MFAVLLFFDSLLSSFFQVSISGVILLQQTNINTTTIIRLGKLGWWLVQVAQGLVRFRELKFIGLNFRSGLRYTAKGFTAISQANISLANIYILLKWFM